MIKTPTPSIEFHIIPGELFNQGPPGYMLTLWGQPHSLKRARGSIDRKTNSIRMRDSQKDIKSALRDMILYKIKPHTPTDRNLSLELKFGFEIPRSWSKKKKENLPYHTSKPDIDNVIKFYLDLLSGVFFTDDRLISKLVAHKGYTDRPFTQIIMK